VRGWTWALLGMALMGCGNAAQQEKIDELAKKVTTLEKRVKAIEGKGKAKGKASKGKAGKGKAKAPVGPKAKVATTGDASKVLLSNGKRKFTLPGDVPAGEYKILASFDAGAEPAEVGTATVTADQPLTIDCEASARRCAAE
jgi:hypothetical protein